MAVCLRFIDKLRSRTVKKPALVNSLEFLRKHSLSHYSPVTVSELQRAEVEIVKIVQMHSFRQEMEMLRCDKIIGIPSSRKEQSTRHSVLRGKSQLCKLDPFLDHVGILRVGGRIQNSQMSDLVKSQWFCLGWDM